MAMKYRIKRVATGNETGQKLAFWVKLPISFENLTDFWLFQDEQTGSLLSFREAATAVAWLNSEAGKGIISQLEGGSGHARAKYIMVPTDEV